MPQGRQQTFITVFLVAAAIVGGLVLTYQHYSSREEPVEEIVQDVSLDEQGFDADTIKQSYWKIHMDAIVAVGDESFNNFVLFTLNEKCPFYEPDGSTYRECLNSFIETELQTFAGSEATLKGFKEYCMEVREPYGIGLGAADLYSSCVAYKLSDEEL